MQVLTIYDPEYQHQLFGIITPTVLLICDTEEIKKEGIKGSDSNIDGNEIRLFEIF